MLRYAITDGSLRVGAGESSWKRLVARSATLARGGIDLILVRERALAAGELVTLTRSIVAAARKAGRGTRVLVAGRADVAVAADADGVHLASGAGELRVQEVRRVFPAAFVSISCHSPEDVRQAREDEASAALFAPVFGKNVDGVEVVAGLGLHSLAEACATAGKMPVFALGGITEANAAECTQAGATGIAGIRMFFGPSQEGSRGLGRSQVAGGDA